MLPTEGGRDSLPSPLSPLLGDTPVLQDRRDLTASSPTSFSNECVSRQPFWSKTPSAEWQLNPLLIKQMHYLLSTLSVDLFATSRNVQLPIFLSPFPDQSANGVDALSHPWDYLGVLCSTEPTVNSGIIRWDSRDDTPGSVVGPGVGPNSLDTAPC